MAVPDSSPRASAVVSIRNLQRPTLADRTFLPPGCCAVQWGCASGPAGLAPEALEECVYSFKVFSQRCRCARCWFQPALVMFQPASAVPCAHIDTRPRSVHIQEV
jgi:hypothetical protein